MHKQLRSRGKRLAYVSFHTLTSRLRRGKMDYTATGLGEGQTSIHSMTPSHLDLTEKGSLMPTSENARRVRRTRSMSLEAEHYTSANPYTPSLENSTTVTPARRDSSQRNSIKRSACPRSSSFLIRQPTGTQRQRPHMPLRSSSAMHARAYSINSSGFYADHTPLSRSAESSVRSGAALDVEPHAHLTSTSLPTLISPINIPELTVNQSSQNLPNALDFEYAPSYSNHVPATTIDWTLPSTRRKQYNEIDRSCRGFRGLVRRCVPSLFRSRRKRVGFYDAERSSDAGTVRRYRVNDDDCDSDVHETENEEYCFGNDIVEKGRTGCLRGRQSRKKWSCFHFGRRATLEKA